MPDLVTPPGARPTLVKGAAPGAPGLLAQIMSKLQPNRAPAIGNTQKKEFTNDADLLTFFNECKREAFADRWIFERQWTRIIHYLNNRQWLAPYSRTDGWRDARVGKGIPRPVNNKANEADQAIRAMFTAINFGVIARPASQTQDAIITAAAVDDLAPLLHDCHNMDTVMHEADYWFVNNGNSILHTFWDYNASYGRMELPYEKCLGCQQEFRVDQISDSKQRCPNCKQMRFVPAFLPNGEPRIDYENQGGARTTPLSLLECAFPFTAPRWQDVPFLVKLNWRRKDELEADPEMADQLEHIQWERKPADRSLQIFKSLPFQNDLPSSRWAADAASSSDAEGISEYELWVRPNQKFPDGLVVRVLGDSSPKIVHLEEREGLPGEIPYKDSKGNPLFTFTHAGYKHVGGRVIASGAHDPVMNKYDALNRIDSMIEMIIMRMASPQWMVPKGSEVQWLGDSPGLPGLVLQWSSQMAGAAGRPERVPGQGVDQSIVKFREMLLQDIEEGLGTFDILRGAKPAGVEAFAALQLLVERGQARFANSFKARGNQYKEWMGFALELERQFGPTQRVLAVMSPTKTYAFKTFQKAQLRGDVEIVIEDGTYTPKTTLGQRAAIEHAKQLGILKPDQGEQTFEVFQALGLTKLVPSMNANIQSALKKQEDFEEWVRRGEFKNLPKDVPAETILMSPYYPLKWRPWYDATIHRQEFIKWANGAPIQNMIAEFPAIEGLLIAHLQEIDLSIMQRMSGSLDPAGFREPPQQPAPTGQGGGMALANSNTNAGNPQGKPAAAAAPAA